MFKCSFGNLWCCVRGAVERDLGQFAEGISVAGTEGLEIAEVLPWFRSPKLCMHLRFYSWEEITMLLEKIPGHIKIIS